MKVQLNKIALQKKLSCAYGLLSTALILASTLITVLFYPLNANASVGDQDNSTVAAKVISAIGDITAGTDKTTFRTLKRRSKIYSEETIKTGAKSQIQIRLVDGALISLAENSTFELTEYHFTKVTGNGRAFM